FLWLLRSGSLIVSIPQKACSALLRGFESRNRDWEPKNRIFVYNAFALLCLPSHLIFLKNSLRLRKNNRELFMEQYKKEFIDFMLECQVLKFGSFTLKSGRQSPFFMNAGAYVTGSQLARLGEYYAKAIHHNFGDDFDVFFGPAYKGIPLAVVTAVAYSKLYGKEIKYCSDRKEEKDHGADKGALLGYKIKDGDRVVIIEDVTTSGKSIEETYPKIKAQETTPGGIKIVGEIVSLDRRERAPDTTKSALETITEKYGFPARAIVTMDDVVDALYTNGDKSVITEEIKKEIDAYYAQYGAQQENY
ncbi:MAG: orotate phosphoribosyltransferase, partial [Treponema sp.]|nr:orotate phosphoribosyltransferase [Treponema sp.]